MFEGTDSVFNMNSVPSNSSYKSFKTKNLTMQNSYCVHRETSIVERLRYPGFGVRVRVVSSCFTDVCNSIILFMFSCNRQ